MLPLKTGSEENADPIRKVGSPLKQHSPDNSTWHGTIGLTGKQQEGPMPPRPNSPAGSLWVQFSETNSHVREGLMRDDEKTAGPSLSHTSTFFLSLQKPSRTDICKAFAYLLVHPAYPQILHIIGDEGVQSDTLSCALDFQVCCR